jgi:5-methylcytosine-specific restriction endonuclease McrA
MVRQQVQIKIPQEYKDNEIKGLCKVCGKSPEEFEKGRRKYCSQKCYDKYQECFLYWSIFSRKWLKENDFCVKCNSKHNLEVDHIIPVAITNKVFDKENLQTLCYGCHKQKTKKDLKKIKNHKNNQEELNI